MLFLLLLLLLLLFFKILIGLKNELLTLDS